MEWADIRNLVWQGKPLFEEVSLGATARPGEPAYQEETIAPLHKKLF